MIFSKRRRKTLITVIAVVLLGAVWAVQHFREATPEYSAGEDTEGIVDVLARDVPENYPRVRFENVAAEIGLRFRHFPALRSNRLPEDMGSGVALGDVNGDGWTDVFLVNIAHALDQPVPTDGSGRSRLFLGAEDGRFTDATDDSGIDLSVLGNGAAFCDVDSDGDLDLFVASYGFCYLYANDGLGRFEDISAAAGLGDHEGFWASVSVADYDRDGGVDIYVGGYVIYDEAAVSSGSSSSQYDRVIPALINPSTFEPERNLLFHGNGDGTFEEVAADLGVADVTGRSLGALFTDINGDGWDDLYVANDVSDNALFLGSAEGTFKDATTEALVGDYRGAMGLAAADFDRDLDVDIFVTHWVGQENALYGQEPRASGNEDGATTPLFRDAAAKSGLGASALDKVGWATRFFDYNNDGWLDLFVVNGHTIPMRNDPDRMRPMRTQLFWHERTRHSFFHGVGAVSGEFFRKEHVGRGGAVFDYDLDGDSDLVVVVHGGEAALLRNDGGNAKPAVLIRLRQPQGNRFALGAQVRIKTTSMQAQEIVGSQGSYLSQHAVGEVAFGLGEEGWVEQIEVLWPDGTTASAGPLLANSIIDWEKGSSPKIRSFPGRATLDADGPSSVDDQKSFYALREKALQARLAGDWDKAVLGYTEALRLWPGHDDCLYYLGNSLIELQTDAPALAVLERLVHFEPQSNQGWMQIGFLRLPGGDADLDNLDEAQAAFDRCHKLNSEETKPVQMLGVVAMLKGDLPMAAKHLADAARLNPRSIPARWFGGRVAWLAGDKTKAQTLLTEARSLAASKA
ncbi:MAG: hypothetical protein GY930_22305, partial [bacterium]|nr:hypothetical protein [bacterium]